MTVEEMPDLVETAQRIARRQISPVELLETTLRQVERLNPILNAYITILADQARVDAETAEREIAGGHYRGPLHGIPVSIKDIFWTKGIRTTGASRLMADFVPTEDAVVVERLRAAGAVLIAKANMLELAYGTVHPDFGPTKNPWDLTKTASGSSGGSAAAVVAGMDFGSIGTDTAGSIRLPAALCGAVGLKPTFGRIPRHGLQLLSWTLDHPGPFGRSVRDVAALLSIVAGSDWRDPTSVDSEVDNYSESLRENLSGLKIGLVTNALAPRLDPEIRGAVEAASLVFTEAGAEMRELVIPEIEGSAADDAMTIILPEASHVHRDWIDSRAGDYSDAAIERLRSGREVSAVDYFAARDAADRFKTKIADLQRDLDLLILPTMPVTSIPLDETTVEVTQGQSGMTSLNHLISPFNLTGQPALSLPCGFTTTGLPIGLQVVGRPFEERYVLAAGHAYQLRTEWHQRRPPVSS